MNLTIEAFYLFPEYWSTTLTKGKKHIYISVKNYHLGIYVVVDIPGRPAQQLNIKHSMVTRVLNRYITKMQKAGWKSSLGKFPAPKRPDKAVEKYFPDEAQQEYYDIQNILAHAEKEMAWYEELVHDADALRTAKWKQERRINRLLDRAGELVQRYA